MVHAGSRIHKPSQWVGEAADVAVAVAEAAGVDREYVESSTERRAAMFRRVAFAALRELNYSYVQIAGLTGGFSSTSVRTGVLLLNEDRLSVARQIANKVRNESGRF